MPFVHSIKYAFGLSNVKISRRLTSYSKHYLANMPQVEEFAKKNNLYLNFVPSKNKKIASMAEMQVKTSEYKHVSSVPEYAVKNNTGGAVYIPVEKTLFKTNVFDSRSEILNKLANFVKDLRS